jgi:hypothetical protein
MSPRRPGCRASRCSSGQDQQAVATEEWSGRKAGAIGTPDPYDPGQRAIGGGLFGASTGAAIGGIAGGGHGAATGAPIGGALGAAGGAATTPSPTYYGYGSSGPGYYGRTYYGSGFYGSGYYGYGY